MTPINLDEVESYLIEQAETNPPGISIRLAQAWIRNRFAELRAREAANRGVRT